MTGAIGRRVARAGALGCILACTALALAPAAAEEKAAFSEEEIRAARAQLAAMLRDAGSLRLRAYRIVRLALIERPDGAFGEVVKRAFEEEGLGFQAVLVRVFLEGDSVARRSILDLYHDEWNTLGQGTDSWRGELVRLGLESADRDVRRAAARLAANRPLPKIGHIMVDATLRHPELTHAAILSLGANRDVRPLRWALDFLESGDPRLKEAVHWSLWATGPAAAGRVRERVTKSDDDPAPAAIEALLFVASEDDSSVLYAWLDRHGDEHPELAERVTDALAGIEIGNYKPPRAARPELEFFDPS